MDWNKRAQDARKSKFHARAAACMSREIAHFTGRVQGSRDVGNQNLRVCIFFTSSALSRRSVTRDKLELNVRTNVHGNSRSERRRRRRNHDRRCSFARLRPCRNAVGSRYARRCFGGHVLTAKVSSPVLTSICLCRIYRGE